MILRPALEPTDSQEVLDFYTKNYSEVHIITCNKCKEDLGIEIFGSVPGYPTNSNGFTVLAFGNRLLASRVRTDGSMGYQCLCGNDTRGTSVEEELSPNGTFLPHEIAAIEERYSDIKWKPKIKVKGNKEVHETFTRERVK